MKRIMLFTFFLASSQAFAEQQVTYTALQGIWSFFLITEDSLANKRFIATEQRLFFQDGANANLEVLSKETDFRQVTRYQLKYTLSLKDNVPYLTLFSLESKQVLGAYIRLPLKDSMEMAGDPNFKTHKQLYQRISDPALFQQRSNSNLTINTNVITNKSD